MTFESYKSTICHQVKELGDLRFIIDILQNDKIRTLYQAKQYPKAFLSSWNDRLLISRKRAAILRKLQRYQVMQIAKSDISKQHSRIVVNRQNSF